MSKISSYGTDFESSAQCWFSIHIHRIVSLALCLEMANPFVSSRVSLYFLLAAALLCTTEAEVGFSSRNFFCK